MSKIRQDGAIVRTFGVTFLSPQTVEYPVRGWDQLIHAVSGVVTVESGTSVWVLPAHRALWVPDGVAHRVRAGSTAALRSVYFRARETRLPRRCCAVNVTPLLRELIEECVRLGALLARKPSHRRLAAVLRDQLRTLPVAPLQLPLPGDDRARRMAALLDASPEVGVAGAARACGASVRTMERLFREETGLPLGVWARRLRLRKAVETLARGTPVTAVAAECGYRSASAFVAMFRRELGETPGRYFFPWT